MLWLKNRCYIVQSRMHGHEISTCKRQIKKNVDVQQNAPSSSRPVGDQQGFNVSDGKTKENEWKVVAQQGNKHDNIQVGAQPQGEKNGSKDDGWNEVRKSRRRRRSRSKGIRNGGGVSESKVDLSYGPDLLHKVTKPVQLPIESDISKGDDKDDGMDGKIMLGAAAVETVSLDEVSKVTQCSMDQNKQIILSGGDSNQDVSISGISNVQDVSISRYGNVQDVSISKNSNLGPTQAKESVDISIQSGPNELSVVDVDASGLRAMLNWRKA